MIELIAPQVVSENVLYEKYGKVVVEKTFLLPNGETIEYLLWGGAIVPSIIFPVVYAETGVHVLALRHFRYGANAFVVEVPGGCPKNDENFKQTAQRELLEETGYEAEKIIRLGGSEPIWFEPAACNTPYIPVLALGCMKVGEPKPTADEVVETLLIPFTEWKEMIRDGRVRDGKTITLTMLAILYFED